MILKNQTNIIILGFQSAVQKSEEKAKLALQTVDGIEREINEADNMIETAENVFIVLLFQKAQNLLNAFFWPKTNSLHSKDKFYYFFNFDFFQKYFYRHYVEQKKMQMKLVKMLKMHKRNLLNKHQK